MLISETHGAISRCLEEDERESKKDLPNHVEQYATLGPIGEDGIFLEFQPRLAVKCHWLLSSPSYLHTHLEEALRVTSNDHLPNWTNSADTPRQHYEELYRADASILVMHRSVLEIRCNFSQQQTCIQNPSSSHKD